jgi:hypothetical protein
MHLSREATMTATDYDRIRRYCRKVWKSHGAYLGDGSDRDATFDDFVQNVVVAILSGDADGDRTMSELAKGVVRDMVRTEERQVDIAIHAAFENGPLSSHIAVPFKRWGGPRENSGGARKGAGRPKKRAA